MGELNSFPHFNMGGRFATPKTKLEKATLTLANLTSDGGILPPQAAREFIKLTTKEAQMLGQMTLVPMRGFEHRISQMKFGSRILRAGAEGTALGASDRAKPDTSEAVLNAKKFIAEIRLRDEVLEDNVEGPAFRQSVMSAIATAVGRDLEEVAFNGDDTSPDAFLAQINGLRKQATSNIVDFADASVNSLELKSMIKTLPVRYRKLRSKMKFMTAHDIELDWRQELANRATAGGDRYLIEDEAVKYGGIPFQPIDIFPVDLNADSDQSEILLSWPKNAFYGVWRQIKMETDRDISSQELIVVVSMRVDFTWGEEEGVVKGINVQAAA